MKTKIFHLFSRSAEWNGFVIAETETAARRVIERIHCIGPVSSCRIVDAFPVGRCVWTQAGLKITAEQHAFGQQQESCTAAS